MNIAMSYSPSTASERMSEAVPRLILASGFQPDYVREVANGHARLGCAVQVIGGDMHATLAFHAGAELLNLRGDDRRDRSLVRELAKLARYYASVLRCVAGSGSPVVYDISIGRPLLRCFMMYPLFRLLGKRIVYTAHNVLPHDADTVANRIIYWIIYRVLVDAIVVHGQAVKERLVEEFDVDTDRVYVIAHGTYHPTDSTAVTRESARRELGIAPGERVLLCFGLQRYYKGTHFVLDAIQNYAAENVTLLIRGHAPDAAYQQFVEEQIRAFGGSATVDARFGVVSDAEMEVLFKAADIVLLPYLEGSQSGIKFMAYAYGRPVLASEIGSLREYIGAGITGETFATGDSGAFRETLELMLSRLSAYSPERIKSYAQEHCSFDTAAKQVHSLCGQWIR